jgi:AraC-like DNA-binding protein
VGVVGEPIARDGEALRLLVAYLEVLRRDGLPAGAELRRLAVSHVHDLVALAIGANRDAAAIATGHGRKAARLQAIKADIAENLGNPELSVATVAKRQRVTPRYIQMLFESEETTFSEFVLGQRLARAFCRLTDPGSAHAAISAIAYEAGFGDLAYFNRSFRRLYGATPSEVRAAADPSGARRGMGRRAKRRERQRAAIALEVV